MVGGGDVALEGTQAGVAGEMQAVDGLGVLGHAFVVMADIVDEGCRCLHRGC